MSSPTHSPITSNRLINEKSPYLLQHAHNPVDWFPWGDEALTLAREKDKLIFLSIGYSTCHWCHVMAHESFEDEAVAAALKNDYIAVKVDREERPDIDQIYMEFCQRLTGRGGWPLNVVLMPDGLPVFAATYLPKEPRQGYAGLIALLEQIPSQAREHEQQLRESGLQLVQSMQPQAPANPEPQLDESLFKRASHELLHNYDSRHSGFGDAPKFPTTHHLTFLLQRWKASGEKRLLKMVEQTLAAMRAGGIYDHLGGGFHRYATDTRWLLPHFEKMLYDQAALAEIYLDAFTATGTQPYADTATETLDYVVNDLADPHGGFHAAEDADSEGEEGLYYLWRRAEVEKLLGPQVAELFCQAYGINEEGNFRDEATGELTGLNVLHLPVPVKQLAGQLQMEPTQLEKHLAPARRALLGERIKRPRPHRDDKLLTAWNGMLISPLAKGARLLTRSDYLEAAQRAADFVLTRLRRSDGRLLRRWRGGEAAIPAFAEDYAFLARGLLDLYRSDFDLRWLQTAFELGGELKHLFAPEQGGALYDSGSDADTLVTRPRTLYDGAIVSANSVAVELFSRLHLLSGEARWRDYAEQIVAHMAPLAARTPSAFTGFLSAAALLDTKSHEAVVVGELQSADTRELLNVLNRHQAVNLCVLHKPPAGAALSELAPFTRRMAMVGDRATVFLCSGQSCQQPTNDPEELRRLLKN